MDKALRNNAHFSIFCNKFIGVTVLEGLGLGKRAEKQLLQVLDTIFADDKRMDMKAVFSGSKGGQLLPYKVPLHDKFTIGCDLMIKLYKKLVELD